MTVVITLPTARLVTRCQWCRRPLHDEQTVKVSFTIGTEHSNERICMDCYAGLLKWRGERYMLRLSPQRR